MWNHRFRRLFPKEKPISQVSNALRQRCFSLAVIENQDFRRQQFFMTDSGLFSLRFFESVHG